jgi:hypothetical protein
MASLVRWQVLTLFGAEELHEIWSRKWLRRVSKHWKNLSLVTFAQTNMMRKLGNQSFFSVATPFVLSALKYDIFKNHNLSLFLSNHWWKLGCTSRRHCYMPLLSKTHVKRQWWWWRVGSSQQPVCVRNAQIEKKWIGFHVIDCRIVKFNFQL